MRKSFDGLAALVRDHLGLDPSSGDQYLFANRRRNRLKIAYEATIPDRQATSRAAVPPVRHGNQSELR
jgi:transposase